MMKNQNYNLKWNEIDIEFFDEIFTRYWNGEFEDKVLEITNLFEFRQHGTKKSLFFGKQININEYPTWNDINISALKNIKDRVQENHKMSSCSLIQGPRITPFFEDVHYNLIKWMWFGEDTNGLEEIRGIDIDKLKKKPYYHYKDNYGNRYITLDDDTESAKREITRGKMKRYVMIRAIPYLVWQEIISDYIRSNCSNVSPKWDGDNFPEMSKIQIIR